MKFRPVAGAVVQRPSQLCLILGAKLYDRLDQAAKKVGLKKSDLVRQMLSHCLDELEETTK